ncbi:MAG: alpha/beta fold hydrolase, partial [Candidatus Nitrotoga sp.]
MRALKLLLLTALLSGCTNLFFHPHRILVDTPDKFGLTYQTEKIKAADGTLLNAWFLPAQNNSPQPKIKPEAKATILFLHGNAENISTHFRSVAWLSLEGFNVLALDYRGYGESKGKPALAGMQLDIDAAMRHLLAHKNADPNKIIIFGQSLGGALAIYYTAHSAYRA